MKMLAPFGVGVLYARKRLLAESLPFLYGGDMIAEGQVFPDHVEYNALPWKYAAGTPNILGTILPRRGCGCCWTLPCIPGGTSTSAAIARSRTPSCWGR
jgi:selenocysteine lyase/cysteine desulfurase